ITYTPAPYYNGTDSFAYRVRDIDGLQSNAAAVVVTVSPMPNAPTLTVQPATGDQDTAIPLQIAAALTDPHEVLTIDVASLPPGARLSAGTLVAVGHYRLTPDQLAGLKITPPPGLTGPFTLDVSATSTEPSTGAQATTAAALLV